MNLHKFVSNNSYIHFFLCICVYLRDVGHKVDVYRISQRNHNLARIDYIKCGARNIFLTSVVFTNIKRDGDSFKCYSRIFPREGNVLLAVPDRYRCSRNLVLILQLWESNDRESIVLVKRKEKVTEHSTRGNSSSIRLSVSGSRLDGLHLLLTANGSHWPGHFKPCNESFASGYSNISV